MGAKIWPKVIRLGEARTMSPKEVLIRYSETVEIIERAIKLRKPGLYHERETFTSTLSCVDRKTEIVIGGLIYSLQKDPETGLELLTIRFQGTKPGFHNKGVGKLLLRDTEKLAREKGLARLNCQPINEYSAEWYVGQGFNSKREDDKGRVWLSKQLAS